MSYATGVEVGRAFPRVHLFGTEGATALCGHDSEVLCGSQEQSYICPECLEKAEITPEPVTVRKVTLQELSDSGINPFAAMLIAESFTQHANPKPVTFKYGNALFHMRPLEGEEA